MRKETKCVHAGSIPDSIAGGLNSPVFPSSAFSYLDREPVPYPRYFNTPNQEAVVRKVCALEGAEDGLLCSSGMAAISTVLFALAGAGDHVVLMDELYGGTHSFATTEFKRFGIACDFAPTDADGICEAVRPDTRVVVIESPTNPLLSVIDIRKVAAFCRERGVLTVIDNTFATPINQNPLGLGIDVVVHSGTKYLGGHSDLCFGLALGARGLMARVRSTGRNLGGSVNAQTCHLIERSLKTLAIRVERQTLNAARITRFLEDNRKIRRVFYPGRAGSPNQGLASSQMEGFGAMLSFEPFGDATALVRALRLIAPAVSLGGIESTICAPAVTSHAKMTAEERRRVGISDSLLRLSVGIEQVDDLIEDLAQAAERCSEQGRC